MSHPQPPASAKLIVGVVLKEKELARGITEALMDAFGRVDLVSPWLPFDFTTYYQKEMGAPLFRRLLAFESLIEQTALVDIKRLTNDMEIKWSKDKKRRINLDPGYLLAERFVLATGKNFSHRIYLNHGIYADLTLIFQKGDFRALPWTYPGYRQSDMHRFLRQARSKYQHDLKNDPDATSQIGATANDS